MKDDWKIYCLMSSIIYIEEMSKPTEHFQVKKYKNHTYRCLSFHSIRLKMKDYKFVKKFFDITKYWENKNKIKLLGKTFKKVRKENYSKQDFFLLTPVWINLILAECGKIPNKYSFQTALKRINYLKQYKKIPIDINKVLFKEFFKDKKLAAGAFILSMDLEFRGIQSGRPSLCMSEKYKDFLDYMLKVAQKWGWTNNEQLSPVNMENSINVGIKASPQFEFRININGLKEIYHLAGPLTNSHKDKCIKFNINRSEKYTNLGGGNKKKRTKEKILYELKSKKDLTTTNLQFKAGVGVDVILGHLHNLENKGLVTKERKGKRYIWNIK